LCARRGRIWRQRLGDVVRRVSWPVSAPSGLSSCRPASRTYDRLIARYDAAEESLDRYVLGAMSSLLRRWGPIEKLTG
jgi:hypothetical protein